MMSEMLSLSACIELDTIGGYPLMDTHIGYLNAGAFHKVRDDNMNFRDGYLPLSDLNRAGAYHIAPGYTAGGMLNLFAPADPVDTAQVAEQVSSSFYTYVDGKASLPPADGETSPLTGKNDIRYDGQKYSFVKAPRYGSVPCEVGPMARMINSREPFIFNIMRMLHDSNTGFLGSSNYTMTSVYTRVLSRMQETLVVARLLGQWINNDLEIHSASRKYCVPVAFTASRTGGSMIEAPRGMLGHWMRLDGGSRIANYQIVSPTAWNASPRDSDAKYGPMELASIGIKTTPRGNLPGSDAKPLSLYHIVRSFDPCMSCAVHTIRYSGLSLRPEGSSAIRGKR
jgi:hydrogenase large subunit